MANIVTTNSGFLDESRKSNALPWSEDLVRIALLPSPEPMVTSLEVALTEEEKRNELKSSLVGLVPSEGTKRISPEAYSRTSETQV